MNERINELAEQAVAEIYGHPYYSTISVNGLVHERHPLGSDDLMKKFAELIVRECAGIYDAIDNGNLVMGTDDYLEALTKRFGVE